jgi:hypothetical protein
LWGGPAGAVLVVAAAQRKAAVARAGSAGPRRVSPVALAAGGLGLFLLGLIPLGLWILLTVMPRPMAPAPPVSYIIPNPTQPGGLPLPGPALVYPTAGATLPGPAQATPMPPASSGLVWTFTWRPPRGSSPGDLYQFTLWPPGEVLPAVQVPIPGTQLRISASAPLLPPAQRGLRAQSAAIPQNGRWPSGPWTWRVRVVRPGQGAGQWSEARPFTPIWSQSPFPGSRPPLRPPFIPPRRG